jgi:hypothetical protein
MFGTTLIFINQFFKKKLGASVVTHPSHPLLNQTHSYGAVRLLRIDESERFCWRFETGGSLGRRVNVAACPSPDGSSARASTKGGERGGQRPA